MKKKIAILGSTGSIGKTLINILKKDKKNTNIILLAANKNIKELLKQALFFNVKNIIISDRIKFLQAKKMLKNKRINIYNDFKSFTKIFSKNKIDYTMCAMSGLVGLEPCLNIIEFTKKIAIANKESIICGWPLIAKKIKKHNVAFIPIDSEHFSIYSLLNKSTNSDIEKIYITASGGPFHKLPLKDFNNITRKDALKHPNWTMGKKISIDSATMMNKVFEVIEAKKIFNVNFNKIEILVHPKSYVHAMIKFKNGITKILIHDTSMMVPIFNSLYEDNKKFIKSKKLNFPLINDLNFSKINIKKFPITKILKFLPEKHSLFETLLVSLNDKLVKMFLNNKIKFVDISKIFLKTVNNKKYEKYKHISPKNVNDIIKLDHYVSTNIQLKSI